MRIALYLAAVGIVSLLLIDVAPAQCVNGVCKYRSVRGPLRTRTTITNRVPTLSVERAAPVATIGLQHAATVSAPVVYVEQSTRTAGAAVTRYTYTTRRLGPIRQAIANFRARRR